MLHLVPRRATLIATLTESPEEALAALPAAVDWVEVRADLLGEIDPEWLRARTDRKLLYTLRSAAEGGASESSPARRAQRITAAWQAGYDLVDLEANLDLGDELLAEIPAEARIISWHGGPADAAALKARFEKMSVHPARLYKLVPTARRPGDDLAPLLFLHALGGSAAHPSRGRQDVIAFATGTQGFWTRLVAPRIGAPVLYGSASALPAAPGQPSIDTLISDYGLPELRPVSTLYGVVGDPVLHSLSPRLHNGAYQRFDIPALYVPFHVTAFGDFWLEIVESAGLEALGLPLRGLSVTSPFKDVALAVAGVASPLAEKIGAANTLFWEDDVWEAEITDPEGVVRPLRDRGVALDGISAVVVGSGGAGRAAALGLLYAGAHVVLANRDPRRGKRAAAELGIPFVPLETLQLGDFQLVVHATSLGRGPEEEAPLSVPELAPGAVVVDLIYRATPTALVSKARQRGLLVVDGREVLLAQALEQFRLMTGHRLPIRTGRQILDLPEWQGPDDAEAPPEGAQGREGAGEPQ